MTGMVWHVVFYKDDNGNEPVKEFINVQSYSARAEIIHVIDLLYRFELSLGKPYVEKVKGKLWALRVQHSSDYYRFFYFAFQDRKFILLHAVKKKSDKLVSRDIEIAIKRMEAYKKNYI